MKSPEKTQTTLRLTKELDERLSHRAAQMGISKNALILMLLSQSFAA